MRSLKLLIALAAVGLCTGLAGFAQALTTPSLGSAGGVDLTCELALVKIDPNVVNVAYPDAAAEYFGITYAGVPGTRIEVDGIYPHARYISWTAYDPALRPIAGINDVHIKPEKGSANPFKFGALRDTPKSKRHYRLFIDFGAKPTHPAANTIYTGTGQDGTPNLTGTILYRIYTPDKGQDDTGGVGLPVVTLEPATTTQGAAPSSACTGLNSPTSSVNINSQIALVNGVPAIDSATKGVFGLNPPKWKKFVNVAYSVTQLVLGSPKLQSVTAPLDGPIDSAALKAGGSGGFLSNLDNAYVAAAISRGYGQVLVARMKVPSFPHTGPKLKRMPRTQVRYWSMCENDPFTERYVACDSDAQTIQRPTGYATFVISTPGQRPSNAIAKCGVNWLPWGPDIAGLLIYRNMLPLASFKQSIQDATAGHEARTMHQYLPVARYYSQSSFEALGCRGAAGAIHEAGS